MQISVVEAPIHNDLYSVSGTDIPPDAVLEFATAVGPVRVTPDFVRPHLAFLFSLPPSIPTGAASVKLTSLSTPASNALAVNVAAGPLRRMQAIQPGEAKARPYTIAFIGNPAIESATGGVFAADPVLTNRPVWQRLLAHCLRNLFGVAEDLLRRGNIDSRLRIVAVFDPTLPPTAAIALVHEIPGSNTMETRRLVLANFLATFGVQADMVFAIHGSTTHTRASAWFTTDDNTLDNYWLSPDDPQLCRLDHLTSAWFADRLNAKLGR